MRSIKSKLILIFCSLVVVSTSLIAYLGFAKSSNGMNEVQYQVLKEKLSADINSANQYLKNEFGYLKLQNEKLVDKNGVSIEERYELVDTILKDLGNVATIFAKENNDFMRVITNIKKEDGSRAVGTFLGGDSKAYNSIIKGKRYVGEADILGESYLTAYDPIKDAKGQIIGILFVGISMTEVEALIQHNLDDIRNYFLLITFIVIIFSILIAFLAGKHITDPTKMAVSHIDTIANFDLTKDIPNKFTNKKDEIGALARSIKSIEDNLRNMIKKVGDTSEQVTSSSEELTATTQQSSIAAEEVAKTISEIAEGATNQAQNTAEGAEKLIELSELIEKDQHKLKELTMASKKVEELAKDGLGVMNNLSSKTKESSRAADDVYNSIIKTNESSTKIDQASNLISEITEQINLLALNAAIEAARAGEYGKGFAVVADEIRKLAEQSTQSTKIIDDMVNALQDNSDIAVKTMDGVGAILEEQVKNMKITEEKYLEIIKAIENTHKIIQGLNDSGHIMEQKKNEVNDTIDALSALAQQNAAGTEEVSASMEEQSASIEEITNASEGLARLAQALQNLISKFRI
ncbi:methyl-accepting chemotaxis protein [Clostridiisalibacter paucivorans]|uniref:methyl-accepting chemotaxis protein n=1 Tax=Clostridiisalibacter paucivorans TaxID=408753 RepID=UPI00047C5EC1|nr:methyl-accepting chemotaxis protein [Clostridiisalibacter paucivorans]